MNESIFAKGKLFELVHLLQKDGRTFEATTWQFHKDGQSLEEGEQVESVEWFTFAEAEQMALRGDMQEERIAPILLQWLKVRL